MRKVVAGAEDAKYDWYFTYMQYHSTDVSGREDNRDLDPGTDQEGEEPRQGRRNRAGDQSFPVLHSQTLAYLGPNVSTCKSKEN